MNKKALGIFLMGALSLCCSCIDDTYDVLNKEISTDMQIKGNKLSLPLGSLCPIPLDSLLVDSLLDSIPILKVDKETRVYSLSFNDSLKTGVDKENLEALKNVSKLSANIDPISIPIEEISFDPEPYSLKKNLDFGEVKLTDITLNEIKPDPIVLELDELTLDPITIPGEEDPRSVKFDIPTVSLNNITIGGGEPKKTNFSINNIELDGVELSDIDKTIPINVTQIDINKTQPPTFSHTQPLTLSDATMEQRLNLILSMVPGGENAQFPTTQTIGINTTESEEESYTVDIQFSYDIPEQIERIDRIVLDPSTSEIKFVLKNPTIVAQNPNLNPTLDFHITFPEGYKLSDEPRYTLSDSRNEISATIPISGEETLVTFHLEEIGGLSDKIDNGKISFTDQATCTIKYKVEGDVTIPQGTTVGEVRNWLKYSFGLDVAFDVKEAYGSISPVESNFTAQTVPFSFSLEGLDYIKSINTVELKDTKFQFTMGLNNGFEDFDIADNSKLVLSFPDAFFFSKDGMSLPNGVKQSTTKANDFEITSFEAFNTTTPWILPISEVKINQTVDNGNLYFSTQATVKAVTGNKENYLTVKGTEGIDLIAAVKKLCTNGREVSLQATDIKLNIEDVKGATNIIDINFDKQVFDFDFEVAGNLKDISHIDYVEFDSDYPITITPSVGSLGNIQLADGSGIAIRFPEKFVFDTNNSTFTYNNTLKAFVINDLSQLNADKWEFRLKQINIDKDVNGTLTFDEEVTLEAINRNSTDIYLHVAGNENFSLKEIRDQGLIGQGKELSFAIKESPIVVKEVQLDTKDINIDFPSPKDITYPISIEGLKYITHIGSIEFKEGENVLKFNTQLTGETLGRFKLAEGSYIELKFPEVFKLDPKASNIPQGGALFTDSSTIRITGLEALNHNWELAVKRIALDEDIENQKFEKNDYAINIASYNAAKEKDKLTIAAIKELKLTEIKGGEREMQISVEESNIAIADVEVSIEDIGVEFKGETYKTPIPTIENLELVKSINYISFKEDNNIISLNILLDGDLGDFDLVDSEVKLSIPSAFVLDDNKCNFSDFNGGLEYRQEESAIYIKSIQSIINHPIQLAIARININQDIVDNKFDWDVNFSVAAVNKANEPDKLYVGCKDNNLRFTEVSPIMGNKTIQIHVKEATLSIDKAEIVSNGVSEEIKETVDIPLKETIPAAIDRVDFIGFAQPVPMTLNISTTGLEKLEDPVNILADITFPPVFDISSNDNNITITEQGLLRIDTAYSFKESLELELSVNNLNFTSLEGGCLALTPDGNGGRVLEYNGSAAINGSVSIAEATVSSDLLKGISMELIFDMGKVVLKDFTGLYSGVIEPIEQSFELGIENGFDDLKENGITLTNTKPELMISIYNPIGVPVDVDLSIVGKDKDGIPTSVIAPEETLRIWPAKFDEQGELVADTTRWFFTSNEEAEAPAGYTPVFIENLATLLDELPYSIDFSLAPTIVTENVKHYVDLTKLELGGSYAISVPFDLKFEQSVPLDFDEEIREILSNNTLSLANPQLALTIYNPIADSLVFDLSIIGKDKDGKPLENFNIDFTDKPFVLKAGVREEDGTITPTATRWLFAVSEEIEGGDYEVKEAPALGTLLANIPHDIDIALNAHFNTNLTQQIDYDNDLELMCEYGISVPLQFKELSLSYADTISEIQLNLQESLEEMNVSISNVGLGIKMNLKNTLPLGLKLNLIPLDAQNNPIQGIKIESIEIPAGKGQAIAEEEIEGTPVELSIQCDSPDTLSALDKIAFSIEVEAGNGDHALSGKQGLQVCDIVLEVKCDAEMNLGK